jgi:hypothetical protein
MHVRLIALFGALALLAPFGAAFAQGGEPAWISLRDGVRAKIYNSGVVGEGATREAVVRFELNDPSVIANHAKAIGIADQLFGRIVLVPAENGEFKRAAVHLLASIGGTAPRFDLAQTGRAGTLEDGAEPGGLDTTAIEGSHAANGRRLC